MTRFALALLALIGLTSLASAQTMVARVVASCGAQSLNAGAPFALTIDTSGNLCSGTAALSGSTSNASDGVATSSTNLPTVGYAYGFNGATWDRLRADTTNGLWVNVKTSVLPTGAASATNQGTANNSLASIDTKTLTLVADPCQANAHAWKPISINAASTTVIVSGTSSKKTYICSIMLFSAGTTNVGIVEGSGSTCGTSTLGLIGGATAATGPNLTAQAGFVAGSGPAAIAATTVNANDICLINSLAIQVSGYIVTAVQ